MLGYQYISQIFTPLKDRALRGIELGLDNLEESDTHMQLYHTLTYILVKYMWIYF